MRFQLTKNCLTKNVVKDLADSAKIADEPRTVADAQTAKNPEDRPTTHRRDAFTGSVLM